MTAKVTVNRTFWMLGRRLVS